MVLLIIEEWGKMADRLTKEQRHKNMSNIHGSDTKIEIALRKALWKEGYRYRKNYKKVFGKPDIVLVKYKTAIFVDGEFWHGKNFDELEKQLENTEQKDFWKEKIRRNIQRDKEVNDKLKEEGWTVIRFWGTDVKKDLQGCVDAINESIERNYPNEV